MKVDKLLRIDSPNKDVQTMKGTEFEELKRRINGICSSLNRSSDEYDTSKTLTSIEKYINLKQHRILYSEISAYIFAMSEHQRGNFVTNVELLLVEAMSKSETINENVLKSVIKIYDHVHLALHQFESLKREDEDIQKMIAKNIEPVTTKFEGKLQDSYKEIYTQLIGLIGIFTALAFLVFGSITSLESIFGVANNIPMLKIMVVASLWGLCLLNLIFIFIFFVSKMTKMDVAGQNSNIYPVVAWGNLILITVLVTASWGYYVSNTQLTDWLIQLLESNEKVVVIGGFLVILSLFTVSCMVIVCKFKKKK